MTKVLEKNNIYPSMDVKYNGTVILQVLRDAFGVRPTIWCSSDHVDNIFVIKTQSMV